MQRYKHFYIGDVDGYDETGMGPCDDGDWVQYSEAQAKIDKLKKRISDMAISNVQSRIKSMRERSIERDRDHDDFMNLVEQWQSAHNDAIESAAKLAQISINSGGIAKSMAHFVSADDWRIYMNACLKYADAIRALKK